ncbi:hypothetical protein D4759_24435 [Clostridiales bacterium AHG0011]|uniref:Ig-like domain-containing protein n=1 Tax=Hungatella hathewayi TaxID=154046 RepID=A0A3E4U9C7_9FIRM|nr:hypothetical protein [Enterocloster citroniae]MCC3398215.1 hypothetical protein [Clostridiales bacterium AHG0011]RGM05022.1 hypothetical protein DXC39_11990 [Hungatella hathewayi]RHM77125.1 hypothetical protein DWZ48_16085 [Hungatella hathewayi]
MTGKRMNAGHTEKLGCLIWRTPVPNPLIIHFFASASTITWLIRQKFELGIPLYLQEKEWEEMGLFFCRTTMSN